MNHQKGRACPGKTLKTIKIGAIQFLKGQDHTRAPIHLIPSFQQTYISTGTKKGTGQSEITSLKIRGRR
jgi:hypothetical protein